MQYRLECKPSVDIVLAYSEGEFLCSAQPRQDAVEKSSVHVFTLQIPPAPVVLDCLLLGYGAGGHTEYAVSDLFSMSVEAREIANPIIVNTPRSIAAVLVMFPARLQEILDVPPVLRLARFDLDTLRRQGLSDADLLKRGFDTSRQPWVSGARLTSTPDADVLQQMPPATVHCYTQYLRTTIDVPADPFSDNRTSS